MDTTTSSIEPKPLPKAKKRDLLSNYYKQAPQPVQSEVSTSSEPLNSPLFNTQQDIILNNEMTLIELITKENKLIHEIKESDIEMKQLIYQNYSKFVFASQTLSSIHESCDVMISNLNKLDAK